MMSVREDATEFIKTFVAQYFTTYDSDNRGNALAMAYHENATMSMAVNFYRVDDDIAQEYKAESRNLNYR